MSTLPFQGTLNLYGFQIAYRYGKEEEDGIEWRVLSGGDADEIETLHQEYGRDVEVAIIKQIHEEIADSVEDYGRI